MSGPCGARFSRLAERAFVRGLSVRQRRQLRGHLAVCETCRARWDRLAAIDRQLAGPALSGETIRGIGDAVLDTVAPAPRRWHVWGIAGGLVAAAAIAMLVLRPASPDSGFVPRGGTAPTPGRTPGVRVFCVAGDRDHVRSEVRLVSSGPVPALRCTMDDDLQLAYTTPAGKPLTMVAFARHDSSFFYYAPTLAGAEAIVLLADRVDELVDWSTRLSASHRPGTYEMIVRFYERPVATADAVLDRVSAVAELRARLEILPPGGNVDGP
jgi:hypothetical protein